MLVCLDRLESNINLGISPTMLTVLGVSPSEQIDEEKSP